MSKKLTLRERVALGECVSEFTTERCPVCIDRCQASEARQRIAEAKRLASINKIKLCTDEGILTVLKENGNDDEGYVEHTTTWN